MPRQFAHCVSIVLVFRSEKSVVLPTIPCKWRWKPDTDWTLYNDKIVFNQLRLSLNFFFNDAIIAALCSQSQWFNESMAKWFHDSGSFMSIFLDDLPSQTGVCLNNGRQWKIAQKQVSFLVLQYKEISLPSDYWNHWQALIVAEDNVSMTPFHSRFSRPSPRRLCWLRYFVLWIQILSELSVIVLGLGGMASVCTDVHSLDSSFCQ